jgi:hypothetical protein
MTLYLYRRKTMKSESLTATIVSFRLSYTVKQELIRIAENATLEIRKVSGENAPAITVSDVIKNALEQTYGVSCG